MKISKLLRGLLGIPNPVSVVLPTRLTYKTPTFHYPDEEYQPLGEVVDWLLDKKCKYKIKPGWQDCVIVFSDPIDSVQFKLSFDFSE